MSKKNTRRNKCMTCGEHYKSFHLCKKPIEFKWSIQQDPNQWTSEWVSIDTFGVAEVSGSGYARQKSVDTFDEWFAPIAKYIEEHLK